MRRETYRSRRVHNSRFIEVPLSIIVGRGQYGLANNYDAVSLAKRRMNGLKSIPVWYSQLGVFVSDPEVEASSEDDSYTSRY